MRIKAKCPSCRRVNRKSIRQKKEIKRSMQLPCDHCDRALFASEWKERGERLKSLQD